jgi:hypothetical protein
MKWLRSWAFTLAAITPVVLVASFVDHGRSWWWIVGVSCWPPYVIGIWEDGDQSMSMEADSPWVLREHMVETRPPVSKRCESVSSQGLRCDLELGHRGHHNALMPSVTRHGWLNPKGTDS